MFVFEISSSWYFLCRILNGKILTIFEEKNIRKISKKIKKIKKVERKCIITQKRQKRRISLNIEIFKNIQKSRKSFVRRKI